MPKNGNHIKTDPEGVVGCENDTALQKTQKYSSAQLAMIMISTFIMFARNSLPLRRPEQSFQVLGILVAA